MVWAQERIPVVELELMWHIYLSTSSWCLFGHRIRTSYSLEELLPENKHFMEHVVTGTRFGFHDGMFTGRSQAAAHLFMSPRNSSNRSWWFRHHSPFQLIVLPISIHQQFISFHISGLRHSGNVKNIDLAIKQQLEALASHPSSWHRQLKKSYICIVFNGFGRWRILTSPSKNRHKQLLPFSTACLNNSGVISVSFQNWVQCGSLYDYPCAGWALQQAAPFGLCNWIAGSRTIDPMVADQTRLGWRDSEDHLQGLDSDHASNLDNVGKFLAQLEGCFRELKDLRNWRSLISPVCWDRKNLSIAFAVFHWQVWSLASLPHIYTPTLKRV